MKAMHFFPAIGNLIQVLFNSICVLMFMSCCLLGDDDHKTRKWTDDSGNFSIQATFVKYAGDKVTLKRDDGAIIEVPFKRLSKTDRKYITDANAEKKKNDANDNRTDQWQDMLGGKLRAVETQNYLIHSQLDAKTTKNVAQSLEKMQKYLQDSTGSMFFIPVRRSTHDIILLRNKDNYLKFLERVKENRPPKNQDVDWSIMPKRTSSWLGPTQFTYNINNQSLRYVKNAVVGTAAYYQLGLATNWNANDWLVTGFAAHNEHNLFKENITYPVKYTFTDPKLNRNWNLILKSFVSREKLEPWDRMFERRIRDYQTIDYVQSKSMVDFLMAEPKNFLAFAMQIRDGVDQNEAIEKAYGQPVAELETRWKKSLK